MRRALLLIPPLTIALASWGTMLNAQSDQKATNDIVDVALEAGSFSTLVKAVQAAGLVGTLRGDGPLTVFAPTDEAFGKLPADTIPSLLLPENRDALSRILTYHVIAGRVDSTTALRAAEVKTVEGQSVSIRLEGGRLRINDATVVANDIEASNGIIHVIDSVLLPPSPDRPDPDTAVVAHLESAIRRGVPLFNAGQTVACTAVYETAVQALLDLPFDLTDESRRALRRAMAESAAHHDSVERAWILRRAMDAVCGEYRTVIRSRHMNNSGEARNSSINTEHVLFSFDEPEPAWFSVNDNVMGGISEGGYSWGESGTAVFSGALSLANNGGFSTMRSPERDLGLGGYDGLILRVRGDGRTYNVSGRIGDNRWDVNNWRKSFDTVADEWIEVKIPFADLVHTVMGRRVAGSGPIAPERIRSLSIMIADKKTEPFRLEIDWIKAYRDEPRS
jgi:uncharacterized surface protein with fasciclin (FAS1) repeats